MHLQITNRAGKFSDAGSAKTNMADEATIVHILDRKYHRNERPSRERTHPGHSIKPSSQTLTLRPADQTAPEKKVDSYSGLERE